MGASAGKSATVSIARLHALGAVLDLVGLVLVVIEALLWVPAAGADRRILVLTLAVVPIAFAVFAVMPRRSGFLADNEAPRRSLLAYGTLAVPAGVTLLTLLLIGVNRNFDGFALLLAADGGRNLWEWFHLRLKQRA